MKRFVLWLVFCAVVSPPAKAAEVPQWRALSIGAGEVSATGGQFSANGRLFAVTTSHYKKRIKTFRVWNTQTTQLIAQWKLPTLQQFALSPNGRLVAVITGESERRGIENPYAVEVRNFYSGQVIRTIIRAGTIKAAIYSLAWSPNGKFLATGSGDQLARVWDVATGRNMVSLRAGGFAGALQFSSDGKVLATVGEDYHVKKSKSQVILWNWKQKTQRGATGFDTYSTYATLTFSPDDEWLAVGNTSSGRMTVLVTRTLLPQVQVNSGVRNPSISFSDDSRLMAFMGANSIAVKQVGSGRTIRRYHLKQSSVPLPLGIKFLPKRQLYWVTTEDFRSLYPDDAPSSSPRLWHTRL